MPTLLVGIPLLQYADDITFFIDRLMETRNLSTLPDTFTDYSGLQINHAKSAYVRFRVSIGGAFLLWNLGDANQNMTHAPFGSALDVGATYNL